MKITILLLLLVLAGHRGVAQNESSLQQARKFYQEDDYAAAIKALEKATVEEPKNPQVPYLMGRAYVDMSNYKKAAFFLEKAISLDSSKSHWMYECGLVYDAVPDFKKSLQFILLAGEKGYKRSNDYLENLGNAYLNVNNYEKGYEVLTEVLRKKPEDPLLLYQIAHACYKMGKMQDAIDHWDKVLTIDENNADALYMIGMAYQKKGEKEKGQQLCDRAIQMDPSLRSKRQRMGGEF